MSKLEIKRLLNQLPESELDKAIYILFWLNFKSGKLTTIEAALNIFKIIRGLFLFSYFQLTKGN